MMSKEENEVDSALDEEKAIRELFGPDIIEALELVADIREKREELARLISGKPGSSV